MVNQNSIFQVASRNGYLEGLNHRERLGVYARMATGRPPLGAKKAESSADEVDPTASSNDNTEPASLDAFTYCTAKYDGEGISATGTGKRAKTKKSLITIEVRFVDDGFGGGLVELPREVQLVLESKCDMADTSEHLNNFLQQSADGKVPESWQKLLDDEVAATWTWELWVLPQVDGMKKLFSFKDGDLAQFLCTTKDAYKNNRGLLYLEAHIVAKVETQQKGRARKRRKMK